MTCISYHQNNPSKILKDGYFILALDEMTFYDKQTPICNDKMTHLAIKCVTMKGLLDKFNEKTELSDVISEKCSKINGKMVKAKF